MKKLCWLGLFKRNIDLTKKDKRGGLELNPHRSGDITRDSLLLLF